MRVSCLLGLSLACLLAACTQPASPTVSDSSDAAATEAAAPEAATTAQPITGEAAAASEDGSAVPAAEQVASDIDAVILDWDGVEKHVAAQKGKVVVLDLWSTDCVPCLREFPHLVELQKKYPDEVVCISVSLDYIGLEGKPPESYRPKVVKFLREQQAEMFNVISSVDSDRLFGRLDLGSIPAVYIYAPDGGLAKRFDDDEGLYGPEGFTYKDQISPFVEELLKGN